MPTNIEWTKVKDASGNVMPGETWNTTAGCSEKSEGCRECYAARMAWRLMHMDGQAGQDYAGTVKKLENGRIVWTGKVNQLGDRLQIPVRNNRPTVYFVDSMSDLFHPGVSFDYIDLVYAIMWLCPHHIFQVLTKYSDRMLEYHKSRGEDCREIMEAAAEIVYTDPHLFYVRERLTGEAREQIGSYQITNELLPHLKAAGWYHDVTYSDFGKDSRLICEAEYPANIWHGVTVEHSRHEKRMEDLLQVPSSVRFVSCEPLLGKVSLPVDAADGSCLIDWVIAGGESGPGARPMHPEWARYLRDQCSEMGGIPFFFKQWGEYLPFQETAQPPFWASCGARTQHDAHGMNMLDPETCQPGKWNGYRWCDETDAMMLSIEEGGPAVNFLKMGKKKTGRLLDGELHEGFPKIVSSELPQDPNQINKS